MPFFTGDKIASGDDVQTLDDLPGEETDKLRNSVAV